MTQQTGDACNKNTAWFIYSKHRVATATVNNKVLITNMQFFFITQSTENYFSASRIRI